VNDNGHLFIVGGRSVLITGATGAFGAAAARGLARGDAKLTLAGGSRDKLEALRSELAQTGAEVAIVNLRPETEADADAMVAAALEAHGGLDTVVTASGLNKVGLITEQPVEDWQTVMDANVKGSWLVCRSAGRCMIKRGGGGKFILVSSTRARLGLPSGYSAYSPSKAAVDLLTKTLACEWGRHRINVNAIGPTVFRSNLTEWMYSDEDPGRATREAMLSRIPLGRLGEPEDFVGAVLFFASPASDFCTGQTLFVDGGYTAG
jgi:NAD(P)-dependent dehydrogenase (short-subunit alcohol dehydrogenase family)